MLPLISLPMMTVKKVPQVSCLDSCSVFCGHCSFPFPLSLYNCSEDHPSRISICPYGFVGFPVTFRMETKFLGNIMTFLLYSPPTQFREELHVPENATHSLASLCLNPSMADSALPYLPPLPTSSGMVPHLPVVILTFDESNAWEHGLLKEDSQILIPSSHAT